jgi:predicted membrane protein
MSTSWNIRSGDGGIQVALPADFQASLDASTSDGKVSLSIPVAVEGQVNHSHIRGTMNGGGPALSLHTGDGSIRLEKS